MKTDIPLVVFIAVVQMTVFASLFWLAEPHWTDSQAQFGALLYIANLSLWVLCIRALSRWNASEGSP